MPNVTCN